MLKKVVLFGLCVVILSVATVSFAEDVYITQKGKKYHKATCRLIKSSETEVLAESLAVEKGYAPCSICFKDDNPQALQKSQDKKSKEK